MANPLMIVPGKAAKLGSRDPDDTDYVGSEEEARAGLLADASEIDKRSEEHTSELQSRSELVCRLLLEKKNTKNERDAICRVV